MSRNVAALALLIVGSVLWFLLVWPTAEEEEELVIGPPVPQPAPAVAQPMAAPSPAVEAEPTEPEPLAEATPEEPAPEAAAPKAEPRDLIEGDQGPVAEYRRAHESERRDSAATDIERHIRAAFPDSGGAPGLFKSVLCRETVCKVEIRWAADRVQPYVAAMKRIGVGDYGKAQQGPGFAAPLALSPIGPKDADGVRLVELYLKRKPPAVVD
jgi:hypothetical protein